MKALGLLVTAVAIGGGVYLYQQDKQKKASTAPTPGQPVAVYGPDGAIIGYVTPTGIYPNQARGGPTFARPPRTSTAGFVETGGCVACGGGMSPRYTPTGEVYDSCVSCEDDYNRMRHLTSSVALAGAFR